VKSNQELFAGSLLLTSWNKRISIMKSYYFLIIPLSLSLLQNYSVM